MKDKFNLRQFLSENRLVHNRVIKEEPLLYKISVNVESKPGIDYGYSIEAGSEEEALSQLKDKMGDLQYKVKSIKGYQIPDPAATEKPGIIDGKPVDRSSLSFDGIDYNDYPEFTDAFIDAADFEDGTPLSDEQVERLQDNLGDELYDLVWNSLHEGLSDREKTLQEDVLRSLREGGYDSSQEVGEEYQNAIEEFLIPVTNKLSPIQSEQLVMRVFDSMDGAMDQGSNAYEQVERFIESNYPKLYSKAQKPVREEADDDDEHDSSWCKLCDEPRGVSDENPYGTCQCS